MAKTGRGAGKGPAGVSRERQRLLAVLESPASITLEVWLDSSEWFIETF